MPKAQNKTVENKKSVQKFINSLVDKGRKDDCKSLIKLMEKVTKKKAVMWGESIVGFGRYQYKYDSGREGDFLALGFSPRKTALTVYILPGYGDFSDLLKQLGPYKKGSSCLYLKNLDSIDIKVLEKIIKKGYQDLKKICKEKGWKFG